MSPAKTTCQQTKRLWVTRQTARNTRTNNTPQTQRDRETDTQRHAHTHRHTETDTQRDRETQRHRDTDTQNAGLDRCCCTHWPKKRRKPMELTLSRFHAPAKSLLVPLNALCLASRRALLLLLDSLDLCPQSKQERKKERKRERKRVGDLHGWLWKAQRGKTWKQEPLTFFKALLLFFQCIELLVEFLL